LFRLSFPRRCSLGHHIFVHCPHFTNLRNEYSKLLLSDTEHLTSDSTLPLPILSHLQRTTAHLFQDDSSWLLHSCFYLGLLPPLLPSTTPFQSLTTELQRLITRLTHSCHTSAIRLAARIWGLVVRDYLSSTGKPGSRRPANRDSLLRASKLSSSPLTVFTPPVTLYTLHFCFTSPDFTYSYIRANEGTNYAT
jgi:hypothetical protein